MDPLYPKFEPLGSEHQLLLADHLALAPRTTCDLSLANLYLWSACEAPSITHIHDNLCILIESHAEPPYFLEPLGANNLVETLDICLKHTGRISRVDERLVNLLAPGHFTVTPLRDHFDYIYEVQSLAELKGKKYDGKRNQIKKFTRNHPGYQFLALDKSHLQHALNLFDRWSRERESGNGSESSEPPANVACQRYAVEKAFADYDRLRLMGGAIFVSGQMEGLLVASSGDKEMVTAHLQYANYKMAGIYQVLLSEACRRIFPSFTYINLEEDLGIPGLRKTKLSYQPLRLEKKFLVTF